MDKPVNCIFCKHWDHGCMFDMTPCRSFSKFILKEKPMNKVIFESVEEFDDFYANCGRNTVGDYDYKVMKEKVIAKGYIRKSDLEILIEEAERAYDDFAYEYDNPGVDTSWSNTVACIKSQRRCIQAMKAEIERLKK